MQFIEKNIHGLPVFELEGKIMGDSESLLLCDRLKEIIDSGEKNILLDFSGVRWINSTGIGFMLSCLTSLRRNGGDFHFIGLQGRVAYYFKITKIESVLKIYETVDEAFNKLSTSEMQF